MRRFNKLVFVLIVVTTLSGCAHINSDFDCPMKNGICCQSLDEVNTAVDRGEIGGSVSALNVSEPTYRFVSRLRYKDGNSGNISPMRYPENVMHVWIAPYEDMSGNYHQASSVYTVIKPGYWAGNPHKENREI